MPSEAPSLGPVAVPCVGMPTLPPIIYSSQGEAGGSVGSLGVKEVSAREVGLEEEVDQRELEVEKGMEELEQLPEEGRAAVEVGMMGI